MIMKLGILYDIHESNEYLLKAIDVLTSRGVDQFILLGDLFETGREIRETVGILRQIKTAGVFGNHDLGLAIEPDHESFDKYGQDVIEFFATLKARHRHGDYLFSHVNPAWDATDNMVYYLSPLPWEDPEFGKSFEVHPCLAQFNGHYHCWLHAVDEIWTHWAGNTPLVLPKGHRHYVVHEAVFQGWCSLLDTDESVLTPICLA
jgi:hypothetical protein